MPISTCRRPSVDSYKSCHLVLPEVAFVLIVGSRSASMATLTSASKLLTRSWKRLPATRSSSRNSSLKASTTKLGSRRSIGWKDPENETTTAVVSLGLFSRTSFPWKLYEEGTASDRNHQTARLMQDSTTYQPTVVYCMLQ